VTVDALVRMANQIAANQAHRPVDEATATVAEHLRLFWAPSMRRDLVAAVDAGTADLDPVARAAVDRLRPPVPTPTPTP
jgi:formate dehydrogenase subunit delta